MQNDTGKKILTHMLTAFIALFLNGLGVYLTIHADIGAGPWDVFNLGLSRTFGIPYGNASILVSLAVLVVDILLREPIGVAMFIDALTVGKAVDFFDHWGIVPAPKSLAGSIVMMLLGLTIMAYTQFWYMRSALGCGPRDTLLVGLSHRLRKIPIGVISIIILAAVTFTGYLLGGPVGIGTLICAFCTGPIMQFAFQTVRFDASAVRHQNFFASVRILFPSLRTGK